MIVYMLDTETTGLIDNMLLAGDSQPWVIEYYGLLVDLVTGDEIREDWHMVKPAAADALTPKITGITGITHDMVAAAPYFSRVAPAIRQAIETAPIVLAHNLSYDRDVLDIEFGRLGEKLNWPKRKICTIEQTIHVKGHRLSMSALYEYLFGESFAGAHRARVDVQALKKCCVELYRREML